MKNIFFIIIFFPLLTLARDIGQTEITTEEGIEVYQKEKYYLLKNNVKQANIKVWYVPGSFELVYGTKKAQSFDPDAVIAIGSIIQGQTKHFDFVCEAVSQGIKDLNVQSEVPVIFCVLTDHNLKQAQDRSGGKHGNKGVEAAVAALKMIQLRHTH